MIILTSPTVARLVGMEEYRKTLQSQLTYHDKKVDYEINRIKHSQWQIDKLITSLGEDGYIEYMSDLKKQRMKSLLMEDEQGMWTYSGLAQRVSNLTGHKIERAYEMPSSKIMPWQNEPKNSPRYYQIASRDALLEVGHGGVEMGTGLGKSFILQLLTKSLGLKTVIMAPSTSIATQLYEEIKHHFGLKKVGLYGDGKKDYKKQITVGISASLTKIEEGTPAWNALSQTEVFIADESHQTPAATLQKVCFGLLKNAPYRFFFSGTQVRGDGLDLVLEGITSTLVYKMTVREGVDQGFLSKPIFTMFKTTSDEEYWSRDSNAMTRAHGFYNKRIIEASALIANKSVRLLNRPTLILIEEMGQFAKLLPHLNVDLAFAHGGVTKENADKVPEAFHNSNPNALVEDFNNGKIKCLIGTSCVATGTDIRAAAQILYLRFGASEVEVKQGVGRGTRIIPGVKKDCFFTDFHVENIESLDRHALIRKAYYEEIYGPVNEVDLCRLHS